MMRSRDHRGIGVYEILGAIFNRNKSKLVNAPAVENVVQVFITFLKECTHGKILDYPKATSPIGTTSWQLVKLTDSKTGQRLDIGPEQWCPHSYRNILTDEVE